MGFFSGIAPIAGAALGGLVGGPSGAMIGAGIGAGISTNLENKQQAAEANRFTAEQNAISSQFSAEQAQKQMDFQERMRATQYQTATEDMKKAGINPMVAYTQGGAGTPTGAMATRPSAIGQQATMKNPMEAAMSSAASISNIKADLALKDTQATKNVADTTASEKSAQLLDAQAASEVMRMPGIPEQIKKITAERLNIEAQKELNSAATHKTQMDTLIRSKGDLPEAESKGTYFKKSPYNPFTFKDVVQGGHSAADLARSLNPLKR